ncbi:DUF1382 family protein [Escherichia coli]
MHKASPVELRTSIEMAHMMRRAINAPLSVR